MRVKYKNLIMIWVLFSFVLLVVCSIIALKIGFFNTRKNVLELNTTSVVNTTNSDAVIVEKPLEVEVEKEVIRYNLPFENEYLGVYTVVGSSSNTLPIKEYPKMRSHENITVFASESVFPEGSLLWIEGIGIRQVQTVYTDETVVYAYFSSESDAVKFGTQELQIYAVNE